MKNQYYPASPMINFVIEMLLGAVRNYPVPLLIPIAFAALWSIWCGVVGRFALLKRGGVLALLFFLGSVLSAALFLLFSVGVVAGGSMGALGNILMIVLLLCTVLMYYGTIPALIFLTIKERAVG